MFKISISANWENQDEYKRLLKNVEYAGQAFQKALDELNEYEMLLNVQGNIVKGEKNEQTNEEEETSGA